MLDLPDAPRNGFPCQHASLPFQEEGQQLEFFRPELEFLVETARGLTGVRLRVTNAADVPNPVFLASDNDTNSDTVDDTVFIVFALVTPWPAGPFATITFDCPADTPVRSPDFDCSFNDASDASTNPVDPAALVCAVTLLEPIP